MRQSRPLGIRVTATRVSTLDVHDSTFTGAYWYDLRARRPGAAVVKRAFDVIGAVALLIVASPLIVFMTLLQRDAIVTRRSIGFRGHIFDRYLFRGRLQWLPQLFNVLEGTMSLVGPRPLREVDVEKLVRRSNVRRFATPPGITGLWQVSGRSNCVGHKGLQLDREYVDRWSLSLDLEILLRTVEVVFTGRDAV